MKICSFYFNPNCTVNEYFRIRCSELCRQVQDQADNNKQLKEYIHDLLDNVMKNNPGLLEKS